MTELTDLRHVGLYHLLLSWPVFVVLGLHHRAVLIKPDDIVDDIVVDDKLRRNRVRQHVDLARGDWREQQVLVLLCGNGVIPRLVQQAAVRCPDLLEAQLRSGLFWCRVDGAQVDKDALLLPACRVYCYLVLRWVNGNV